MRKEEREEIMTHISEICNTDVNVIRENYEPQREAVPGMANCSLSKLEDITHMERHLNGIIMRNEFYSEARDGRGKRVLNR